MTNSTAYTAKTPTPAITADELIANMQAAVAMIEPEPLAEWMRAQGKDPKNGWLVVLPAELREAFGPFPPSYARFSLVAEAGHAYFFKNRLLRLP